MPKVQAREEATHDVKCPHQDVGNQVLQSRRGRTDRESASALCRRWRG